MHRHIIKHWHDVLTVLFLKYNWVTYLKYKLLSPLDFCSAPIGCRSYRESGIRTSTLHSYTSLLWSVEEVPKSQGARKLTVTELGIQTKSSYIPCNSQTPFPKCTWMMTQKVIPDSPQAGDIASCLPSAPPGEGLLHIQPEGNIPTEAWSRGQGQVDQGLGEISMNYTSFKPHATLSNYGSLHKKMPKFQEFSPV